MSVPTRHIESMLLNFQTTNETDFRYGDIKPLKHTIYKEKLLSCRRVRPPPLKEIATLTDWKSPHVPFNLFGKPKDIVCTNPNILQKPYDKPVDQEIELVRKTRPRLIVTSIGSLDDFPEECQQFVLDNVYESTTHKEWRTTIGLALRNVTNVRSPLPAEAAPANPITLPNLTPLYVSPEWRMDSVSWDNKQLRADCNCTKEFWLRRRSYR